ncbi:MAG: hypothetical protein KatS3mg003_1415 [Candidatus Nitrosocaldaceae archaeon]|nr:MAG: hypothetical protein KatS3mg003_1415 [Candidatus Nitrosocaldaceae archaeon]
MKIKVDDILNAISILDNRFNLDLGSKILLVQDGTLEYALSIISKKKVKFEVTKQVEYDKYIEREAILIGDYTIIARSIIYKDILPKQIIEDIRKKELGIGKILKRHKLETFRDIIEVGYDDNIYRVYNIIHNSNIAITIKECIIHSS